MPRGPNTESGKAIVSRNAVKHGVRSTSPVIPGIETEDAWRRHRDGVFESLTPQGHLQHTLADRIALLLWRLHRVTRYETALIASSVERAADRYTVTEEMASQHPDLDILPTTPEYILRKQEAVVVPDDPDLDKVMRYEAHLHRQWVQTLHELEALQARGNGQPAHLARLDISLPPAS